MFSKGCSSEISLATVTPSWVTVGEPNFLSRATLRPLGPRVALTASAIRSMPFLSDGRASSSNTSGFAIEIILPFRIDQSELANDGQDVIFFEHEVLFIIELELSTTVLGEQDAVALAHINGGTIAIVKQAAGADSNHSTLLGLLLVIVGNHDSTLGNFFFGGCFDDHAVPHRTNLF